MTITEQEDSDVIISVGKKTKTNPQTNDSKKQKIEGAGMFRTYRVLGRVCDHVPVALQNRGSAFYVTTSIGNAFQIYECEHLRLLFVGILPEGGGVITCISSHKDYTIIGCDNGQLHLYERGELLVSVQHQTVSIVSMEVIGPVVYILHSNGYLCGCDISTLTISTSIQTLGYDDHDMVTCMVHPATYLNKVLIGSKSGLLSLWNFHTNKLIHNFKPFQSPISCLSQSPILDVVAVGLKDGSVILYHIRKDVILREITPIWTEDRPSVTNISFRSDGVPHLAISNSHGSICIWNLDQDAQHHMIDRHSNGHSDGHVHAHYIPNQPILISTGQDNSMKEWIFETHSQDCRLLGHRDGHKSPPNVIAFYGSLRGGPELDEQQCSDHFILSAGRDRTLRQFSVYKDSQNVQISSLKEHVPIITGMSYCHTRRKDWDNLVTCHQEKRYALTWRLEHMSLGKHKLSSRDGSNITQVLLSPCGNYAILGCQSGMVDIFNIQSGIYQFSIQSEAGSKVLGLGITTGNKHLLVVHSCGKVRVWNYYERKLVSSFDIQMAVVKFAFIMESNLFALASSGGDIVVYDLDSIMNMNLNPVRKFTGAHKQLINGLCFRSDSRWVLSCGLDSYIKVWDVVSGHLVTSLKLSNVPLCMAISPNGDYLATCQSDSVGIHIHVNASHYGILDGAASAKFNDSSLWDLESKFHIMSDVATMSWRRLLHLDQIRERNKPKRPVKAPEKIPFFLTMLQQANIRDTIDEKTELDVIDGDTDMQGGAMAGEFEQMLLSGQNDDFKSFHEYLKALSYSTLDFELKTGLKSRELKTEFMSYVSHCIEKGMDIDLVFAILNVFLKSHCSDICQDPQLKESAGKLSHILDGRWKKLEELFHQSLCFIQYMKGTL